MDKLTTFPGVGRKTANLVRALAFDIPSISVDIHVFRISKRLGWASGDKPETVEEELKEIFTIKQHHPEPCYVDPGKNAGVLFYHIWDLSILVVNN